MMFPYFAALKIALILTLLGLIGVQTWRVDRLQKELAQIEATANEAQTQTENNLETIRAKIPEMVEAAGDNAVRNYLSRHPHPRRNPVDCPKPDGLRADSGGQASSPEGSDVAPRELLAPDPEFIKACARDAGRLQLWIELCRLNPLTCQVVD